MNTRFLPIAIALTALAGLMFNPNAFALNPNHDCSYCHSLHAAPGQGLLNDTSVEALCLSCHGAAGIATRKAEIHTNVEGSAYAPFSQTCTDCHDPHSDMDNWLGGTNIMLVKDQITTPNSGVKDVVFESRGSDIPEPTLHSFADNDEDGNSIYDGVCEVCHTQTTHHLNTGDPFDPAHDNVGRTCVSCHPHNANFAASLTSCSSCHNSVQDDGNNLPPGGRRAVMDEFARVSSHGGAAITDEDCQVCHEIGDNHRLGYVRLYNVDTAAIIELTGDPTTDSVEAAKLTTFCLACHDADGAGGFIPFSDNLVPPVVDASLWAAGSHEAIGALSCYGDGVFGCHASGHGSEKLNMLAPDGVAPTAPDFAEEEEGACYVCHDSDGPAGTDLATVFTQSTRHPVVDSEQSGTGRDTECTTCHNQHYATATPARTNSNLASGKLKGVSGVNVAGNPVAEITYEYELCFKCHSNYAGAGNNPGDGGPGSVNIAALVDPSNITFHPVVGPQDNAYATAVQGRRDVVITMEPPWNQVVDAHDTMWCSDCHEDPSVAGAHASGQASMLKAPIAAADIGDGWYTPLCVVCHKYSVYRLGGEGSRFSAHNNNNHAAPDWSGGYGGCLSCHYGGGPSTPLVGVHGSNDTFSFVNGTRIVDWAPGTCTVVSGGDSACGGHTKSY